MKPVWAIGHSTRNACITPEEWIITDEVFGTTTISINEMGELWAVNEDNSHGVCLACFKDHYELLAKITKEALSIFEQHLDPTDQKRVGNY